MRSFLLVFDVFKIKKSKNLVDTQKYPPKNMLTQCRNATNIHQFLIFFSVSPLQKCEVQCYGCMSLN